MLHDKTIFDIKKQHSASGIFDISIYPELEHLRSYLPNTKIYISNDTARHLGFKGLFQSVREILFIIKQKPDIIQHVEDLSFFNTFLFWIFRKKLVVTIHDGRPHTGDESLLSRVIRKIYTKYICKFILLTKSEGTLFSKKYGIDSQRINYSHLGYYDILNIYGNKDLNRKKQILFFGRISPYKGVEFLLKAMVKVHKVFPDVKLIVAGSGKYSFDISEYQKLDYIEFRNKYIGLDELSDLIRESLISVCPYTEATQSGVIYSSFALETPVIATRVGGIPDMIDEGKTGLLVSPCDIDKLAEAILILLSDNRKLMDMKVAIRESAKSGLRSWKDAADAYIRVYKNMM